MRSIFPAPIWILCRCLCEIVREHSCFCRGNVSMRPRCIEFKEPLESTCHIFRITGRTTMQRMTMPRMRMKRMWPWFRRQFAFEHLHHQTCCLLDLSCNQASNNQQQVTEAGENVFCLTGGCFRVDMGHQPGISCAWHGKMLNRAGAMFQQFLLVRRFHVKLQSYHD